MAAILNRKNWNSEEEYFETRLTDETRRVAWWYGTGRTGSWIVQILDNIGNQIGDAEYYANKGMIPERY